MAGGTILKLGYSDPLTDTFGAHPTLGAVIDLNDGATFTLVSPEGLEIAAPPRSLVLAGNIRTQGEVATRSITRHNRTVTARLIVGPSASSSALFASIRNLLTWLAAPPQTPITLAYQPFNASTPLYLDVVGASHNLPSDEGQWLRGQFEPLTITFICRPGLRDVRVTLQNLVPNAGVEQPSTASVLAFNDTYASSASLNTYTVVAGAAPTFAVGSITLTSGATVTFGSPAWSDFAQWEVRFVWLSALTATFYLHYTDASNYLAARLTSTTLTLVQVVGGVSHTLNTQSFAALTNAVGYFLQITQFPAAPNEVAMVQAVLTLSSGGLPGPVTATAGPSPTFDAVTALSGPLGFAASGANLQVGSINNVAIFGPGGWGFATTTSSSTASGAWERTTANTHPGGPVASLGALRIDAPPTGAFDGKWQLYRGGAAPTWTAGSFPLAVTAGQQLAGSVWAKSSGLSASATVELTITEYDASGTLLRSGVVATHTGNLAAWTQLAGTYTTGAGCVWVDMGCHASDATSGSANATVWFDNLQCWNKTQLASMTAMPWCDLRAVVSPATLVLSGLVGDLPAPAHLAVGGYISSSPNLPAGGYLSLYLGRKGVTSPNAQFVNQSYGAYDPAFSPQSLPTLDATTYGGVNPSATFGNGGGWNPRTLSLTAKDAAGSYHLLARAMSRQSSGNLPNVSLRAATAQQTNPWFNLPSGADIVGQWVGSAISPFTAVNTWTIVDVGPCLVPPFPQGALTDPAKLYLTPRAQWQDSSTGTAQELISWQLLLPVDGSLIVATVNNPSNSSGAISAQWLWAYSDGLLLNRSAATDGPSWLYSLESSPTPNPAAGAGGAGTQSSGAVNVNSGADPCLTLDPTLVGNNGSMGVNQLVALVTDQGGTVLPCYTEVTYAPLYLEPR